MTRRLLAGICIFALLFGLGAFVNHVLVVTYASP